MSVSDKELPEVPKDSMDSTQNDQCSGQASAPCSWCTSCAGFLHRQSAEHVQFKPLIVDLWQSCAKMAAAAQLTRPGGAASPTALLCRRQRGGQGYVSAVYTSPALAFAAPWPILHPCNA